MSRNIDRFYRPDMWLELKRRAKDELGLYIVPTSVDRDYREQYAYWCQGRESLKDVNAARKIAGLAPITPAENNKHVTWTLQSKHLVNPDDERNDNDKSMAVDFGIISEGKYIGSLKADVNRDNISDYLQVAILAESIGFKSGRHFKNPDYPHLEITNEQRKRMPS